MRLVFALVATLCTSAADGCLLYVVQICTLSLLLGLFAVHRSSLLLQMSHVAWSVSLSVFRTRVSCAKTAEPIEMPLED